MAELDTQVKSLAEEVQSAIAKLKKTGQEKSSGIVTRVGDGVAWIWGLRDVGYAEMIEIEGVKGQVTAFALNLLEDEIGAVLLGEDEQIRAGASARTSGQVLSVPVGPELVGRVVDPLGRPLDGKGAIKTKTMGAVENPAPGVIDRKSVHEPLLSGITAIDAMIPIGRGQRELIIGDRQTGKTAIALDAIVNQRGKDLTCIYVAIGQKESKVAKIVAKLEAEGAMEHTIVLVAGASDPAALWY